MIRVNDAELPFMDGETLGSLLSRAGSLHPFMVVSLNGEFLRREQWGEIKVKDGDIVRTVEMIAGG